MKLKDLAVKHPYYSSDSNYNGLGFATDYQTWDEFYSENGDADLNMNLVFRWDIHKKDKGGYYMEIFMVHQRKGRYVPFFIDTVTEADVPQILEFLKPRLKRLKSLWEPLL